MRARIGQVLEIATERGLAYVQYVSRHGKYGDTIRILPGLFTTRPRDFSRLVHGHAYFAFYPLRMAVAQNLITPVAIEPIPVGLERPQRLRRRGAIANDGRVETWLVIDGDREELRSELSLDEKRLPIASIWNHALLVQRIAEEWAPEKVG